MDIEIDFDDDHADRSRQTVSPAYIRHLLRLQQQRLTEMIDTKFQAALDEITALFTSAGGNDATDVAAARAEDLAALEALIVTLKAGAGGNPAGSVTLITTALPDGVVGSAYNGTLSFSGNTGAVTVTSSPASDNGVTVNADGTVTGTPSGPADSSFSLTFVDSVGANGSGTVTLHSA
jgi:hypothetical protein